nr:MAG TPA: hypothetical protein [Caudoviricetes sp.]
MVDKLRQIHRNGASHGIVQILHLTGLAIHELFGMQSVLNAVKYYWLQFLNHKLCPCYHSHLSFLF